MVYTGSGVVFRRLGRYLLGVFSHHISGNKVSVSNPDSTQQWHVTTREAEPIYCKGKYACICYAGLALCQQSSKNESIGRIFSLQLRKIHLKFFESCLLLLCFTVALWVTIPFQS